MKKTIKTGLMIALFIVCIFLLLPFVITERTHEQKDEQLRTAQPQVYSSNPLTAFFQRAKDLLASHHPHKDSADAKSKAARAARAAQKHQNKDKNNPNNVLAAQRAEQTGNGQGSNGYGYSSNYTPKNYDFALYERPTQNKQTSSDSLFEQTPAENRKATLHPFAANAARFAGVLGLNAGRGTKSVATANNHTADFAQNALAAAKRNSQRSNNTISALTSASQQDTDKMIYDIVKMRADAKYPNPQTQAERLARDEFMKAETERYRQHLRDLYRHSIIDPDNPGTEPDIEERKDILGDIIFDENLTKINTIAPAPTDNDTSAAGPITDSEDQGLTPQDVLEQQLLKNELDFNTLPKEVQDKLVEDIALIVILGNTTPETIAKVTAQLQQQEQLEQEQQQEQEGQERQAAAQENEQPQAQTENAPKQKTMSEQYKKSLEGYKWLYETACPNDDCWWVAAKEKAYMKDLTEGLSYAHAHLNGDPLGKEAVLFQDYMKKEGMQQDLDVDNMEWDQIENIMQETDQKIEEFDSFTPYIPYTLEEIKTLQGFIYPGSPAYSNILSEYIPAENLIVGPHNFNECHTSVCVGEETTQARINNLSFQNKSDQFVQQEHTQVVKEGVKGQLRNQTEKNLK